MITDAMHTPTTIAPKAFFQSMPRRDATRAPVQAPVPGSGIPTKSTSPQNSYCWIFSLLPIARFSSFSISPRKHFIFFIHWKIFLINSRINGMGKIFPIIQIGIACTADTFRSELASSPPRSSRSGIIEIRKTTAFSDI